MMQGEMHDSSKEVIVIALMFSALNNFVAVRAHLGIRGQVSGDPRL